MWDIVQQFADGSAFESKDPRHKHTDARTLFLQAKCGDALLQVRIAFLIHRSAITNPRGEVYSLPAA